MIDLAITDTGDEGCVVEAMSPRSDHVIFPALNNKDKRG